MASAFRLDTSYETTGGIRYQNNRHVKSKVNAEDWKAACGDDSCSKATRVALFTIAGASIGGITLNAPGAIGGAFIGFGIGVCTIL